MTPSSHEHEVIRLIRAGDCPLEKRTQWTQIVAEAFDDYTVRTYDWRAFSASIRRRPLATGALGLVQTGPCQVSTSAPNLLERRAGLVTVVLALSGEFTLDHEGVRRRVTTGQAAVVDSLRLHRLRTEKPAKVLCFSIERAALDSGLMALEGAPVLFSPDDPIAAITLDLVRQTWRLHPRMNAGQRSDVELAIARLVGECLARQTSSCEPASAHVLSMICRAKRIAMQSFGNPHFGPNELARELGVTRRYLTTLFRSVHDMPGDYIRRIRLHIAWDHLTDAGSDRSISQMGDQVGFIDRSGFSRMFKSAFGVTPRDARRLKMT